jgi:hypothetical protein
MRKFTISLPTPSDLGKAARATKTSVSSRVHSDARLASKVEKLRTKLDKAVTDFNEAYKPEVTVVVPQHVSLGSNVSA